MVEYPMPFADLKKLDLHDQDLESFAIDSFSKKINLVISTYNEETADYDTWELIFFNVENINTKNLSFEKDSSLEIYSFDVSENLQKLFVRLILLFGFGKHNAELSFVFENAIKRINQ
jgi:hypothetical protein